MLIQNSGDRIRKKRKQKEKVLANTVLVGSMCNTAMAQPNGVHPLLLYRTEGVAAIHRLHSQQGARAVHPLPPRRLQDHLDTYTNPSRPLLPPRDVLFLRAHT